MQLVTGYAVEYRIRTKTQRSTRKQIRNPSTFLDDVATQEAWHAHVNLFLMSRWHVDWTSKPKQKCFVASTQACCEDIWKKKKLLYLKRIVTTTRFLPGTTKATNKVTRKRHTHHLHKYTIRLLPKVSYSYRCKGGYCVKQWLTLQGHSSSTICKLCAQEQSHTSTTPNTRRYNTGKSHRHARVYVTGVQANK